MTPKKEKNLAIVDWKPLFLYTLQETGHVGRACIAAGISRNTAYTHRRDESDFARAWDVSLEDAAWSLEDEAWRRAREGVDEPIVYQGMVIGTQKRYSDTLLMFMLKGIKPDKFADKLVVRISPEHAAILMKAGISASDAWNQMMQSLASNEVDA